MAMRKIHALLAALALTACANSAPESIGKTRSAIVGGTEESADPAVVAIYVGPAQACSGSIIAKNLVLTAGHCAVNDALLTVPGVSVLFGENADADGAREIYVKKWVKHPKYTGEGNPYDVAIFTLEKDVTDVAPMTLIGTPIGSAAIGTPIRHVGYGENDEKNQSGEGLKRTATYPIHRIEPFLLWSGGTGEQTCEGDSGGPALLMDNGVEKIVGVVSGGANCHDDGSDARVDVAEIHDWIAQIAGLPLSVPAPAASTDAPPATSGAPTTPASPPAAAAPPANAEAAKATSTSGCNAGGGEGVSGWFLVALALLGSRRRR
jgi:uncharacterized protein (TIGR03382 family)